MAEEANKKALAPSRMMDFFSEITNRILRQAAVADTQTWLFAALDTPPTKCNQNSHRISQLQLLCGKKTNGKKWLPPNYM